MKALPFPFAAGIFILSASAKVIHTGFFMQLYKIIIRGFNLPWDCGIIIDGQI